MIDLDDINGASQLFETEDCDDLTVLTDSHSMELLVRKALDESLVVFSEVGDGMVEHTWAGHTVVSGCGYCEVVAVLSGDSLRISLDTGIRVPRERMREVNKLIMLKNGRFRVNGFEFVRSPDETVKFAFSLSESQLRGEEVKKLPSDSYEAGREIRERLLAMAEREYGREGSLARYLQLAMSSVSDNEQGFNRIVYGGEKALEVL